MQKKHNYNVRLMQNIIAYSLFFSLLIHKCQTCCLILIGKFMGRKLCSFRVRLCMWASPSLLNSSHTTQQYAVQIYNHSSTNTLLKNRHQEKTNSNSSNNLRATRITNHCAMQRKCSTDFMSSGESQQTHSVPLGASLSI